MDDLIAKLEAATEGSRELDVEIVFALYPESVYRPQCVGDEPIFWSEPYYKRECPAFTTSLDAALTLVPEGQGWGVLAGEPGTDGVFHNAYVTKPRDVPLQSGPCRTPALALCIAALNARAAQ